MPQVGILSDIHANAPALEAVIAELKSVDDLWVIGDTLGYGPYPGPTWLRITQLAPGVWLAGNHDYYVLPLRLYLATRGQKTEDVPEAAVVLDGTGYFVRSDGSKVHTHGPRESAWIIAGIHRDVLSQAFLQALASLKTHETVAENIYVAHAVYEPIHEDSHMHAVEEYLWTPSDLLTLPNAQALVARRFSDKPTLHISGHTHCPAFWACNPEMEWEVLRPCTDECSLQVGYFYHLNPGSVGFPRDPNFPCPNAMILDTDKWTVRWIQAAYDVQEVRREMKNCGYPTDTFSEEQLFHCQDT